MSLDYYSIFGTFILCKPSTADSRCSQRSRGSFFVEYNCSACFGSSGAPGLEARINNIGSVSFEGVFVNGENPPGFAKDSQGIEPPDA
jgi:hypothetical protein